MHWLKKAREKQKGKKVCVNCIHFYLETSDWESITQWEAIGCNKIEDRPEREEWNIESRYYRCFNAGSDS